MRRAVLAGFLAVAGAAAALAQEEAVSGIGAVVRGLDKVNGRTIDVELPSGSTARMLGLEVSLADCRYPVDNPTGDAYAFLTVRERDKPEIWFEGWMIASSPALSALDHARYDVWVLRCITS